MSHIRAKTRAEEVWTTFGPRSRATRGQIGRALFGRQLHNWLTPMDADGPVYERVPFVRADGPLANWVRRYKAGERCFGIAELEGLFRAKLSTVVGAFRLARAGFAVVALRGAQVELRVADPHAARIVNEARCGVDPNGYTANQLVEAFLSVRDPRRRGVRVTDSRRIKLDDVLQDDWGIRADGLLTRERRVTLRSCWTYSDAALRPATPQSVGQCGARPLTPGVMSEPRTATATRRGSTAPVESASAPPAQSGGTAKSSIPAGPVRMRDTALRPEKEIRTCAEDDFVEF